MRTNLKFISQSLTVSTKTEAMLVHADDKFLFIEYPTNKVPNPNNLSVKGNRIVVLTEVQFEKLKKCFDKYYIMKKGKNYLHAPSFIEGYCVSNGLEGLGLLV